MTLDDLQAICPKTPAATLARFVKPLNLTIAEFNIKHVREFIAQLAHESGGFVYTSEIWGPTKAQERYEGRKDLGNTQPGDGKRFKGRGLIQVTGRGNYTECAAALDLELLEHPEILEQPFEAARSAGWFWESNDLDGFNDFEKLTRCINGGVTGLADRYAYLGRAKAVLA